MKHCNFIGLGSHTKALETGRVLNIPSRQVNELDTSPDGTSGSGSAVEDSCTAPWQTHDRPTLYWFQHGKHSGKGFQPNKKAAKNTALTVIIYLSMKFI